MAKKDKLLDLVHTLSMSEKRYFNVFSQRHVTKGNTHYLQLFELACSLDSPDSKAFEAAVHDHNIKAKYLAADKNYLYNLLMRALSNFHAGRTNSMMVKEWLLHIEILFDKGLYDQCLHLTSKARQAAEKYDLFALLMEISLWERRVLGEFDEISKIKESHSMVLDHLGFMDNMHAFMLLYYRLLEMEEDLRKKPEQERINILRKFIAHPFLTSESVPLSFQARRHYWMIFALYYQLLNLREEELRANEQLIEAMDSNAQYREEYPWDYVEVYSRILNLKLYDQAQDFPKWLSFFREFPKKLKKAPRNVQARITLDAFLFEIPWLIREEKWDLVPEAITQLSNNISMYRRQVTVEQRLESIFWEGRYLEAIRKPADAIRVLTPLINEFEDDERLDIQVFGRILFLQSHYLRENYTTLPYLADSTLRMIASQKERFGLESWIIRQFRRLAKVEFRGESYARTIFKGILENWESKVSENQPSRIHEYLNVKDWVEAKM